MLNSLFWKRLAAAGFCTLVVTAAVASYADAKFAIEASRNASNVLTGERSQTSETSMTGEALTQATARLAKNALDKQALAARLVDLREKNRPDAALKLQALLGQVSRRSSEYLRAEIQLADQTKDLNRAITALDRWASLSSAKRKEIFPVLIRALTEPGGATLIKQRETRLWYLQFLTLGARDPKSLKVVARYLLENPVPPGDLQHQLLKTIVKGYVAQNEIALAQRFANIFGSTNADWNSISWTDKITDQKPNPLMWEYPNSETQIKISKNGDLIVAIRGDIGTQPIALKRMAFPPSQIIQINTNIDGIERQATRGFSWSINCGNLPIEQTSSAVLESDPSKSIASIVFKTRPDCSGYKLMLKYISNDDYDQISIFKISTPTAHNKIQVKSVKI